MKPTRSSALVLWVFKRPSLRESSRDSFNLPPIEADEWMWRTWRSRCWRWWNQHRGRPHGNPRQPA